MTELLTSLPDLIALCLAALLLAAGGHKLMARDRMRKVAIRFGGVPYTFANAAVTAIAATELAAGAGLVLPASRPVAALAALAIWTAYTALLARATLRGDAEADCGCSFGSNKKGIGTGAFVRNVLLIVASAGVAFTGSGAFVPLFIPAALGFLALYLAAEQISALSAFKTR